MKILNEPGEWNFFISHTQRNAAAVGLAEKMTNDLQRRNHSIWFDVNMRDKSEAAMKEGVQKSKCVLAIITGSVVNNDRPGDDPESNAYFQRDYCVKELRWAREAGVPIQPIVRAEDKQRIGELLEVAPDDLKDLGGTDFIHLDRSDIDYWNVGIDKVLQAFSLMNPRYGQRLFSTSYSESNDDSQEPADANTDGPSVDAVALTSGQAQKWRWFFWSREAILCSDPDAPLLGMRTLLRRGDLIPVDVSDEEIVQGALNDYRCLSHRWDTKKHPDPSMVKKRKLIEILLRNKDIKGLWIDFCCLPQGDKSDAESHFFTESLVKVNILYLCGRVIAMLDQKYAGRFWTQYELFLALHKATLNGLETVSEEERDAKCMVVELGAAVDATVAYMVNRPHCVRLSVPPQIRSFSKPKRTHRAECASPTVQLPPPPDWNLGFFPRSKAALHSLERSKRP